MSVQPKCNYTRHMEELFHIFIYMKKYGRSKIVLNERISNWKGKNFSVQGWTNFYQDAIELELSPLITIQSVNVAQENCFVDEDHASDHLICQSQSRSVLFVNSAPVSW